MEDFVISKAQGNSLTPHQEEVGDQLVEAIKEGSQRRFVLMGAAGVGKTTLVANLVKRFIRDYTINKQYNNGMVYVTAPTNKALSVLQTKINNSGTAIEFKTIHSALKLRMQTNGKTGERKFVQAYSKTDKDREFRTCKVCFVDEASMVNTEILDMLKDFPFPIIFVGDKYQINPVGELITPVFERGYPVFELTEIVRQGAGNPIIELSRDIDLIYFKEPHIIDGGKGYVYDNNQDNFIELLAEANGTDEVKYLAYTNQQVDSINAAVRKRIYGNPRKIELGETIVFDLPMYPYYTNQEVKIENLEVITDNIPVPRYSTKFDYTTDQPINGTDFIKLRFYRINGSFNIIHEDSESIYKQIATSIKDNCKKFAWNWKGYFYFTESLFANTKYNHAITVHKSQGSTYKTTILNIGNIGFCKDASERERLLYTGITRASDLLILNNVK